MTEADIIQKLLRKSMDWFLYDIDLRHERVKIQTIIIETRREFSNTAFWK